MYDEAYFKKRERYSSRKDLLTRTVMAIRRQVFPPARVLDVGCGTGRLTKMLNEYGYQATGVDNAEILKKITVDPDNLVVIDCRKLYFPDQYFDVVISSDFLEHIAENEIDDYVNEMCRVGKVVLARISFKPDGEYHLTVKPKSWWQEKLGDRVILIT